MVAPAGAAELQGRNPGARSIRVPGVGHMVPWDQPERFLAAIEQLLAPPAEVPG